MDQSNTTSNTGTQPTESNQQPQTFADIIAATHRSWLATSQQSLSERIQQLRAERTANTVNLIMNETRSNPA